MYIKEYFLYFFDVKYMSMQSDRLIFLISKDIVRFFHNTHMLIVSSKYTSHQRIHDSPDFGHGNVHEVSGVDVLYDHTGCVHWVDGVIVPRRGVDRKGLQAVLLGAATVVVL